MAVLRAKQPESPLRVYLTGVTSEAAGWSKWNEHTRNLCPLREGFLFCVCVCVCLQCRISWHSLKSTERHKDWPTQEKKKKIDPLSLGLRDQENTRFPWKYQKKDIYIGVRKHTGLRHRLRYLRTNTHKSWGECKRSTHLGRHELR